MTLSIVNSFFIYTEFGVLYVAVIPVSCTYIAYT
jgi:hypothetical protein